MELKKIEINLPEPNGWTEDCDSCVRLKKEYKEKLDREVDRLNGIIYQVIWDNWKSFYDKCEKEYDKQPKPKEWDVWNDYQKKFKRIEAIVLMTRDEMDLIYPFTTKPPRVKNMWKAALIELPAKIFDTYIPVEKITYGKSKELKALWI